MGCGHVLLLASRSVCNAADGSVVQSQPIRHLSLAVPVPMDSLNDGRVALGLGALPLKQLCELRSAHIPLPTRDLDDRLVAFHIPFEFLDKVFLP